METEENKDNYLALPEIPEGGEGAPASKTEDLTAANDFFIKGREFEVSGKWGEAAEYYRKSIYCAPENGDYHFRLGKALYELKQFEGAIKTLEKAKQIKPLAAHIHLYLGMAHDSVGELEKAVESLKLAVSLVVSPIADFDKWHARIGGCYLRLGLFAEAEISFSKAITLEPTYKPYWIRLCEILELQNKIPEAINAFCVAAEKTDNPSEFWSKGASLLVKLRRWDQAANFAEKAISSVGTPKLELYNQLSEILRRDKKYWREIEVQEEALVHFPEAALSWFSLGEARSIMGHWTQAAEAYTRAIALLPDSSDWHYRLGTVYEADGRYELAQECYKRAVSQERKSHGLGVGWFHFQQGLWFKAIESFEIQASMTPVNPTLHSFLASSFENCGVWLKAQQHYLKALALDSTTFDLHIKLGAVSERLEDWGIALEAYTYASNFPETKKNSQSALANLYGVTNELELACDSWIAYFSHEYPAVITCENSTQDVNDPGPQILVSASNKSYKERLNYQRIELISTALKDDASDPALWWSLGDAYNKAGDQSLALENYRNALSRENNLNPLWQCQLGLALFRSKQFLYANEVFSELALWKVLNDEWAVKKNIKPSQLEARTYLHFYSTASVRDDTVFYEVDRGNKFGGDPLAIFTQLLSSRASEKLMHVWAFNDLTCLPSIFKKVTNVIAVQRGSPLYCKYLATSKYLVSNSAFEPYFIRREGQRYLNSALNENKDFAFTDQQLSISSGNLVRNLHHATHVLCDGSELSCEFIAFRTCLSFPSRMVANIGAPRLENRLASKNQIREEILESLALNEQTPIIFLLSRIQDHQIINDLVSLSCQLVECYEFEGKVCLKNLLNRREMRGIFDVLDGACSSDLLLIDSEQGFANDKATSVRSIVLNLSSMTSLEVVNKVGNIIGQESAWEYTLAESVYGPGLLDGQSATQRAIDFFFDDLCGEVLSVKEESCSLVFGGIFIPNGITKSFSNLLENIKSARRRIAVIVSPESIFPYPDRYEILSALPKDVLSICRVGEMAVTNEEETVISYFEKHNSFASDEARDLYHRAFSREFVRVFGYVNWKSVVNFEGYNRFWTSLLASRVDTKKIVFLHSDMVSECRTRFPNMDGLFKIYKNYNSLVAVSQPMMEVNREKLSGIYEIPAERFNYCNNTVDGEEVINRARKEIATDVEDWISEESLFVSIGRLSTEKDHKKLINAFVGALASGVVAKLMIIGDGPLRLSLERQIIDLGAENAIKLVGYLDNPFPLLMRSDCFVHSSNHEGQPIVLLEAMVLGKPIIATDIAGNRGTLGSGHGRIVNNEEDAIRDAIIEFLQDSLTSSEFDYKNYNKQAVERFFKVID